MLAPLNKITPNKRKFKWNKFGQDSFDQINPIIAHDNLLPYPDSNEAFKIHTNASKFRLGAVIIQKVKMISVYSRKFTYAQKRYTVTERDLLRIFKTLKEFRTTLIGQILIIYTNNKNLTCRNFNTDRLLRWRLILKEYGPDIKYIKGDKNIVSGALSILPLNRNQEATQKSTYKN